MFSNRREGDFIPPRFFYIQNHKEVHFMWSVVSHFFSFTLGTMAGVVLMCLLQVAKRTDEQLSNLTETKKEANE